MKSDSLFYRPEIDGLRALAVLSVVLFHAHLKCPGGYVGVDVFFVISGYLITSVILRELNTDRFCLAEFWERRIRRIFPALNVMVLMTILVGGFVFLPLDYQRLGNSAIAQSLMAANFYFWRYDTIRGQGYFGPTSDDRPLLHTWSLSVEEQFYLFFPLILICLFRVRRFRDPVILSRLMFGGLLGGFLLAGIGLHFRPAATFYLLPTRAWELLCGAWMASLATRRIPQSRVVREVSSWIGLAGILLPCWLYNSETPFPGLAALPPCLGTVLVVWSNSRSADGGAGLTSVGRILSLRPVVYIGLISYSLYLWHWPVLVYGNYWWLEKGSFPWYMSGGLLLFAGIVAHFSWRYVETPCRRKSLIIPRSAVFRFAAVGTLLAVLLGTVLVVLHGVPVRMPSAAVKAYPAKWDRPGDDRTSIDDVRQGRLIPLGDAGMGGEPRVLLWGDSHAMCASVAIDALCRELRITGGAVIEYGTPPLLDAVFLPADFGLGEEAPEFSAAVLQQIEERKFTDVVLAARWSMAQERDSQLLERTLPATIRALREKGCRVWVLQDVPDVDKDAPKAFAWSVLSGGDTNHWRRQESEHFRKNSVIYKLAKQNLPAIFLDPAPLLWDSQSDRYRADIDGVPIYYDDNHLTKAASIVLLLPLFRESMAKDLAGSPKVMVPHIPVARSCEIPAAAVGVD